MKDVHELEIYSSIKDFPNYLVTSKGRVFSLKDNKGKRRIKKLKQSKAIGGYLHVTLHKNGKRYTKSVHRLVAQAFIPNPDNKPQVNHIDENKTNNHVTNLEWVTAKENCNHGTHNERMIKTNSDGRLKGINNGRAKSIIGFKVNGCDIKYYKYIRESEKDGFGESHIVRCCRKQRKSHKGYVWYYTDEFFNKNK